MKPVKIGSKVSRKVKEKQNRNSDGNNLFYKGFWSIIILFFLIIVSPFFYLLGQDPEIIASGNVTVQGVKLQVDPISQSVPVNMETAVNTTFTVENPGVLDGMVVKGELQGPGFKEPLILTTLPNHPFTIPGIITKGTYKLENIHLERKGKILVYAEPQQVEIDVMDIIVTKVETRPLTLNEIREKGIVISQENFTAYNFTIGFKVDSELVSYSFPVIYGQNSEVKIPKIESLPLITWKAENNVKPQQLSKVPTPIHFENNYTEMPEDEAANEMLPPSVSGIVLFNNDIAFLNQFFSVMFIISNHAPEGSNIVLKDLTASITCPDGLREAETNPPHIKGTPIPVRCPGPDGKIGTADDLEIIMASFSGMAEFLAEGLEKGTHTVNINFNGTLTGLPSGDAPIKGTASGAVIVRHPEFSITFAHPSVIRKGEEYDVVVTMTNTSPIAANLASLIMPATRLVGTSLLSDESVSFETIEPGESVNATFHLLSKETGQVRATAFEGDSNVRGQFVLTVGVGEQGIPLSPDTLVLPDYAYSFPNELIDACLLLLGEAYSIATTPPGGLPEHLPIISKGVVEDRVREFSEAAKCYLYSDSLFNSMAILTLDWLGNKEEDINFDILRRLTTKGLKVAEQQTNVFKQELSGKTANEFILGFTQNCSYKSPFISAVLSFPGGTRSAHLRVTDYYQNKLSNEKGETELIREIPYGEFYLLSDSGSNPVDFAVIGHLDEEGYKLEILGTDNGAFDLSVIVPDINDNFRLVEFSNVSVMTGVVAELSLTVSDDTFILYVDSDNDPTTAAEEVTGNVTAVAHPPLELISAVQDCNADGYGHATALFFSRPLDRESAENKDNYHVEGKEIYASFLQPSGRIVIIGTNSPISPFVESRVKVENVMDETGQILTPSPVEMPILATTQMNGGMVYGHVLSVTGQPITHTQVQLIERNSGNRIPSQTMTDESGYYQFDFVHIFNYPFCIQVMDPETGKVEQVKSRLMGNGQRQEITIVMRGMSSLTGIITDINGNPVQGAKVVVAAENASVSGSNSWGGFTGVTDASGNYLINNIPIGHINVTAYKDNQFGYGSASILAAGEMLHMDLTLSAIGIGTVSGLVFESDGITPVANTIVNIFGSNYFASSTQTNDQGYFEFQDVPIGSIEIKAYNMKTAQVGGEVNSELLEGQDFNTAIILRGNGRIYGIIQDAAGLAMPGILVYLDGTSIYMESDSNGQFDFPNVPVGQYYIKAISQTSQTTAFQLVQVLVEDQNVYAVLKFPADNSLRGTITGTLFDVDGVTPLSDVMVQLSDGNFLCKEKVFTDELGKFEFLDLGMGNYILFAAIEAKVGVSRCGIITPGQIVFKDITMRGEGKLLIHTYAPDGQTPVMADVELHRIKFVLTEGSQIGFVSRPDFYTTDENGYLEVEKVLIGDIYIKAKNSFYPRGNSYSGAIVSPGEEKTVNLVMQPTGKITGHVYSWDNSTPVGGVAVEFRNNTMSYSVLSTETGDIGYFEFNLVHPGWFTLKANDSISGLQGYSGGTMGPEGELVEVDVRLHGRGEVNGAVKTPSDEVVPNAIVKLNTKSYPYGKYETTADENGLFTIYQVWEGEFSVTAYDPITQRGGASQGTIAGHNAQTTVEIIVDPIGSVKGHVLNSDGTEEIIDVQVGLYHLDFQYQSIGYDYVTEAGPNGGFQFENVPDGKFYIEAFLPTTGRKGRTYGELFSEGEVVELDINLEGRGTVKGAFFDGSHIDPIPNASITMKSQGKYPFTLVSSTDANGFFEFSEVGQGNFELSATDPDNGLMGISTGIIEYDGQLVTTNVYAQGWGQVKGVVYKSDGITKVANARVELKQGERIFTEYTGTDPNAPPEQNALGEFHFTFVPMGGFSINATDQAGRDHGSASGLVEFHGHEDEADVLLTGLGVVKGRVLDGGGNPLGGIPVTLQSGTEKFNGVSSDGSGDLPLGDFRFEQVRMGSFSLVAKETVNGLSGNGNGELTSDGQEMSIDLTLESAGRVTGTVLLSDGTTPVENALVKIKGTNLFRHTYTNAVGEFEFTGIRLINFNLEISTENNTGKAFLTDELVSHGEVKDFGNIVLDDVLPNVTHVTPVDNSTNMPNNTTINIEFSEPMTESQLNSSTIRLVSSLGNTAGTISVAQDLLSLVFTPSAPLVNFTLYTLIVDQSVTDSAGNTMAGTFTSSFSTIDSQGPQVVQVIPANNMFQVGIDSNITLYFDESVDPLSAGTQNIVLNQDATVINCTPQWVEGNLSVVLIPDYLTTNKVYTLSVQGLKDMLGNIQAEPFTSTFYTTDTVIPSFESCDPAPGSSILEGSDTYLTATYIDDDIEKVYYYMNGKYIGNRPWPTLNSDGRAFRLEFKAPLISQVGDQYLMEVVAQDHAGNLSEKEAMTYQLQADQPPSVYLTDPGVTTVLPGDVLQYKVSAYDDLYLNRISFIATGGTFYHKVDRDVIRTDMTFDYKYFDITIPSDILPGTQIKIYGEAEDNRGNVSTSSEIYIQVPTDEQAPDIVITSPVSGTHFNYNDTINIAANVTDDINVKEVKIYMDDQLLETHSTKPFTATYQVPILNQDQTSEVRVEAEDFSGKMSTASVNVVLEKLADATAPQVKILSPSTSSLVFPGENLKIKVEATDDQGVSQVELFVDNQSVAVLTQSPYEYTYVIPVDAVVGSTIDIRATGIDVDSKTSEDQVHLEVITGTFINAGVVITPENMDYENQTIIIREGVVTINGTHSFLNVLVKETGQLTHSYCTTTSLYTMDISVSGKLVVGCDASVNVTGRGYLGAYRSDNSTQYGYTLGNTNTVGSHYNSGGSYGGFGGFNWGYRLVQIYGSIDTPSDHGSGGGGTSTSSYYRGGNGGGVMMLNTSHIINDGVMNSNGFNAYNGGAGSGGSVQIHTSILSGSGEISANGGNSTNHGAGGGGRIAIYYQDITAFDLNKITAYGGVNGRNYSRLHGYCGTVYLKAPNQEAQLFLDNNNIETYTRQTYPDLGHSQITNLSSNVLTDSTAGFMPDSLIGMELIPDINNITQTFTIIDNDQTTITTDPADGDLTSAAAVGDIFEGMAVFNGHIIIRNNPAAYIHDTVRVNRLSILDNSTMAPKSIALRNMNYCILSMDISGDFYVDDTSSIDLTAYGYLGGYRGNNNYTFNGKSEFNGTNYGRTLGDTTSGGSYRFSAASHGGLGGKYGSDFVNEYYGAVYLPESPGSGGGAYTSSEKGGNGGGVILINCGQFLNNGVIKANGGDGINNGGGGSGGSIQIHADILSGNGNITVNGGNSKYKCGGGGGRIALYYDEATNFDFANVTAFGGYPTNNSTQTYKGSAGTIYEEQNGYTGNIMVNNGTMNSTRITPIAVDTSTSGTSGTITALEPQRLIDANAQFIPGNLIGMMVIPNIAHAEKPAFKIIDNTETEIFTDPLEGDMTQVAAVGDQYRLKYSSKLVLDGSLVNLQGSLIFEELSLLNSELTVNGSLEATQVDFQDSQVNITGGMTASSINLTNTQMNLTGSMEVGPFILDNSHLTLDGNLDAGALTMQSGSEITHSESTSTTVYSLQINAQEMVIGEGCSIHANHCGYLGSAQGDNMDARGRTLGNTNDGASFYFSGASHGGWGGVDNILNSHAVNMPYGSFTHPTDPGSGGGGAIGNPSNPGGSGGGVIYIQTTELTNNGQISSNGQSSTYGAGAGGSIQVHANILSGIGTISANGGNSNNYGAASGGRIAIYYQDASSFDLSKINAYGGANLGGLGTPDPKLHGAPGTVYLKPENQEGQLVIDNNNIETEGRVVFPAIGPGNITALSATVLTDSNASYMIDSLIGLKLIPNINDKSQVFTIVDNDQTSITIDSGEGDLTTVAAVGDTYEGKVDFHGHLKIQNTPVAILNGEVQLENFSVLQNSNLQHTPTTEQNVGYLNLSIANQVILDDGSSINVNGLGYLGAYRNEAKNNSRGYTFGNTSTGGSEAYTGASHGGLGGLYSTNNVNAVYGSLYEPINPGSGGGGPSTTYFGGNGGGVVMIQAQELVNDGEISTNGGPASYGAGSGGSVLIKVNTLRGTGTITANGGNCVHYGAGGGGRIAVYYEDASGFNLDNITAYGGDDTNLPEINNIGGAGTVYLKASTDTLGTLIVDNNNLISREDSTPLPAVGQGFNTLLETSKMTNTAASFIPGALIGLKLNPQPTMSNLFTIINNSGTEIFTRTDDGDMTLVGSNGSAYIGEHQLLNLTVKGGARLFTLDRVQVTGILTIEPSSTFTAENHN